MKINLVAHASVLIDTGDCLILTDPWLYGKAFNDSWCLSMRPNYNIAELEKATHLWISHEHPDHFHMETLRSFSSKFKERVIVLFQDNHSDKVPNALRSLGFKNIERLPHRKKHWLNYQTYVYCYQAGLMDSALGVVSGKEVLLNLNDCQFYKKDAQLVLRDLGHVDTLLNQFGYATYNGMPDPQHRLKREAGAILDGMVQNHRDLKAKVTMPFASYVAFCSSENFYMNQHANKPSDVKRRFLQEGLECELFPIEGAGGIKLQEPTQVSLEELGVAFRKGVFLRMNLCFPIRSFTAYLYDIRKAVEFNPSRGTLFEREFNENDCDLTAGSQALAYAFQHPWGMQTLSISGRFQIRKSFKRWMAYRLLCAFHNAEITWDTMRTRRFWRWVWSRREGLLAQFINQGRSIL